jgi:hypothetical protein
MAENSGRIFYSHGAIAWDRNYGVRIWKTVLNATAVVNTTKARALRVSAGLVGPYFVSLADVWLCLYRCSTRWTWTQATRCGPPTSSSTRRLGWMSATGTVSMHAGRELRATSVLRPSSQDVGALGPVANMKALLP